MMLDNDCIINGHTAGASGKKLNAYVSSGILSCHEPVNFEQVLERLRLGMWIMIREGSIRRDLKEILPGVMNHKTNTAGLGGPLAACRRRPRGRLRRDAASEETSIKLGLD